MRTDAIHLLNSYQPSPLKSNTRFNRRQVAPHKGIKEAFYGSTSVPVVLQHSEKIPMALPMQLVLLIERLLPGYCLHAALTGTILALEYKSRVNGRNSWIELFRPLEDDQAYKRKRTNSFKRANLGDFSILPFPPLLIILGLSVGG